MMENKESLTLVRILGKDIKGNKTIYSGLTEIEGISWALSNAICKKLKISRSKIVSQLSQNEIKSIEEFIKNPSIPSFLKNRRKDFTTGEDTHLIMADLELTKNFDIKRLKKIKSYRGIRHSQGLPVRGQRTRSNFRRNRRKYGAIGVKKKKK